MTTQPNYPPGTTPGYLVDSFIRQQDSIVVAQNGGDFKFIQQAIDSAATHASATRPFQIDVRAGIYSETLILSPYITILAPSAILNGTIAMVDFSYVKFQQVINSTAGTLTISKLTGTGTSLVEAQVLNVSGGAIGIINIGVNSILIVRANVILVGAGSIGVGDLSANLGHIHLWADDIYLQGAAAIGIIKIGAGTSILAFVQHIREIGAHANTVGINVISGEVEFIGHEIIADTAYTIGAAGTLRGLVNEVTGTETNNGTRRLIKSDDGMYPNLKSGANQAAAGADPGELWVDTAAANVVKLGV